METFPPLAGDGLLQPQPPQPGGEVDGEGEEGAGQEEAGSTLLPPQVSAL